jgi:hypothetical protein
MSGTCVCLRFTNRFGLLYAPRKMCIITRTRLLSKDPSARHATCFATQPWWNALMQYARYCPLLVYLLQTIKGTNTLPCLNKSKRTRRHLSCLFVYFSYILRIKNLLFPINAVYQLFPIKTVFILLPPALPSTSITWDRGVRERTIYDAKQRDSQVTMHIKYSNWVWEVLERARKSLTSKY